MLIRTYGCKISPSKFDIFGAPLRFQFFIFGRVQFGNQDYLYFTSLIATYKASLDKAMMFIVNS